MDDEMKAGGGQVVGQPLGFDWRPMQHSWVDDRPGLGGGALDTVPLGSGARGNKDRCGAEWYSQPRERPEGEDTCVCQTAGAEKDPVSPETSLAPHGELDRPSSSCF